jgi:hypothetical protein
MLGESGKECMLQFYVRGRNGVELNFFKMEHRSVFMVDSRFGCLKLHRNWINIIDGTAGW